MIFILMLTLVLIHHGYIDYRIYRYDKGEHDNWLTSDELYLAPIPFLLFGLINFVPSTQLIYHFLAGLFFGSVGWDLIFGKLVYNEWFRPYRKWYVIFNKYNVGPTTRSSRIIFDLIRLVIGVGFTYAVL